MTMEDGTQEAVEDVDDECYLCETIRFTTL